MYGTYNYENKAIKATIGIGYPLTIGEKVATAHRKMISESLDKFVDKAYVKQVTPDNIVYWQKGFVVVYKYKKELKHYKGVHSIEIEIFDTRYYPMDMIMEKLKA